MPFQDVLVRAFRLLKDEPRIFIPRLVMTLIWSVFWIYLMYLFQSPLDITLLHIMYVSIFVLVMTPAELWMYNAYFLMVKQRHNDNGIDMVDAFHQGLYRLPQSIAVFSLLGTMALIFGMPGAIMYLYGANMDQVLLQIGGVLLSTTAVFGVMMSAYFTPVSVVLGEKSFFQNLKEGIMASRDEQHGIFLITIFSFLFLILAGMARGSLQQIGLIGFLLGRVLASVQSVYILVINPELFLQREQRLNGEDSEEK